MSGPELNPSGISGASGSVRSGVVALTLQPVASPAASALPLAPPGSASISRADRDRPDSQDTMRMDDSQQSDSSAAAAHTQTAGGELETGGGLQRLTEGEAGGGGGAARPPVDCGEWLRNARRHFDQLQQQMQEVRHSHQSAAACGRPSKGSEWATGCATQPAAAAAAQPFRSATAACPPLSSCSHFHCW